MSARSQNRIKEQSGEGVCVKLDLLDYVAMPLAESEVTSLPQSVNLRSKSQENEFRTDTGCLLSGSSFQENLLSSLRLKGP